MPWRSWHEIPSNKGLEEQFRRLTGVKRETFKKMIKILREADRKKKVTQASTKTGKWTNQVVAERLKNRKLTSEARSFLLSVLEKAELYERMNAGDTGALIELTERESGEKVERFDEDELDLE